MKTKSFVRRLAACVLAAASVAILSSCNTTSGIGRDVEKAGHGIHRAADRAM